MHYLIHGPAAYAIVEDAAQAQKHVDAGWQRATRAEVMARWRARDLVTIAEVEPPSETAPLSGWTRYGVDGKEIKS